MYSSGPVVPREHHSPRLGSHSGDSRRLRRRRDDAIEEAKVIARMDKDR